MVLVILVLKQIANTNVNLSTTKLSASAKVDINSAPTANPVSTSTNVLATMETASTCASIMMVPSLVLAIQAMI